MNLANKITLARIIIIPVFMVFLLCTKIPYNSLIALVLFIAAAATDGIDGHIARKYNQITTFGKFIDPLADKLLIATALICLVELSYVSSVVAVIIIARELAVTGLRTVAVSSGKVIAASTSGKVKTVVQIISICIAIVLGGSMYGFLGICISGTLISNIAMWIAAAITLYSGVEYLIKNRSVIDYNK